MHHLDQESIVILLGYRHRYMVVSQNKGTQYRRQSIIVLIMGPPKKVLLILGNNHTGIRECASFAPAPVASSVQGLGVDFGDGWMPGSLKSRLVGCGLFQEDFQSLAQVGSIPHPVMGTTRDYCRYSRVLLIRY